MKKLLLVGFFVVFVVFLLVGEGEMELPRRVLWAYLLFQGTKFPGFSS